MYADVRASILHTILIYIFQVQLPQNHKKGDHPLALHEVAPESERKTNVYAVMNMMEVRTGP